MCVLHLPKDICAMCVLHLPSSALNLCKEVTGKEVSGKKPGNKTLVKRSQFPEVLKRKKSC